MDKKFVGLISLLFLSIFLLLGLYVTRGKVNPFTALNPRAAEETVPSIDNSLIFSWPLTTTADGKSESKVEVFARNKDNDPILDKSVTLLTTLGEIKPVVPKTNKAGQATFIITSSSPGVAEISATIDNVRIKKTIRIVFE